VDTTIHVLLELYIKMVHNLIVLMLEKCPLWHTYMLDVVCHSSIAPLRMLFTAGLDVQPKLLHFSRTMVSRQSRLNPADYKTQQRVYQSRVFTFSTSLSLTRVLSYLLYNMCQIL